MTDTTAYHQEWADRLNEFARASGQPCTFTFTPEFVADARTQPWWAGQEAVAHTLAYDARIMGDYSIPTETAASVKVPTLVLAGGADMPFMRETAQALADAIPDGEVRFLDGQGHNVDPTVLAPALKDFLSS